jgi:hypothetical protein
VKIREGVGVLYIALVFKCYFLVKYLE